MKKYIYLIIFIGIMTGCASPKSYMKKGKYDSAVREAVIKLRKRPTGEKNIAVLEKAYPLANEKDINRINYLKKEGKPEAWDEIFVLYSRLKDRQDMVKTVLPLNYQGRIVQFNLVDYDKEIIHAKENAAEYYYAHAQKLMEMNDRESFRKAYYDLMQVKKFYANYRDVDAFMKQAKEKGMSHALVTVKNQSPVKISNRFEKDMLSFGVTELNTEWVEYYLHTPEKGITVDYTVTVNLKMIDVSPEQIKEEHIEESKEVEDGWQYLLDEKGNVKKDSLGNDIKMPKYKEIRCKLIKGIQRKAAHIEGAVDYRDASSGQVLKTIPIAADHFFEHVSAMAIGDINALSPASKKFLGIVPMPFPPDGVMIENAAETLRPIILKALRDNKWFLK